MSRMLLVAAAADAVAGALACGGDGGTVPGPDPDPQGSITIVPGAITLNGTRDRDTGATSYQHELPATSTSCQLPARAASYQLQFSGPVSLVPLSLVPSCP
jgi:hypothetical protein